MTQNAPLQSKNPPYSSFVFLDGARHIVTILSYVLGYYSDQWMDEDIISFLSILSMESKPSFLFKLNQFLTDAIHEQLVNFFTDEVFH